MWFNELPVGSTSQYAQWSVFRLAKEQGITVLLDGQGADELLGGYEQYFVHYLDAIARDVSPDIVAGERAKIMERYPLALSGTIAGGMAAKLPQGLRWQLADWSGRGSDFLFGLSREAMVQVSGTTLRDLDNRFNALSKVLKDDSLHAHLPTLLRYGDRNSMAHSREVRLPFCDHRLAEFVLSLKPQILMGKTQTKQLLRAAMEDTLPGKIHQRWNKQGFLPPQEKWFSSTLLHMFTDTLNSPEFTSRWYWNAAWWQKVLKRFEAGEKHLAWVLWRPLIAESWYRHFVRQVSDTPRTAVFI